MAKKKVNPKELAQEVTGRFMQAMAEIIADHKRTNGKYQSVNDFAKSVSGNAAYMSQYSAPAKRNVTLEMCCKMCKVHGVDSNWLLLGIGERYFKAEQGKFDQINTRIAALEKMLKKGKK